MINIAIVEDNKEVHEFLIEIFSNHEDFCLKGSYFNAEDALLFIPQNDIDIIIMDIGLPNMSGIDCLEQLKSQNDSLEFIMLTVFENEESIFEALKKGASGYLLKNTEESEIIIAIKECLNGGSPMTPVIARKVTKFFNQNSKPKSNRIDVLSKRENQIIQLLSEGLLYKEIAIELDITTGTVKQHIHKIYKTLQVQNRTEAINKFFKR